MNFRYDLSMLKESLRGPFVEHIKRTTDKLRDYIDNAGGPDDIIEIIPVNNGDIIRTSNSTLTTEMKIESLLLNSLPVDYALDYITEYDSKKDKEKKENKLPGLSPVSMAQSEMLMSALAGLTDNFASVHGDTKISGALAGLAMLKAAELAELDGDKYDNIKLGEISKKAREALEESSETAESENNSESDNGSENDNGSILRVLPGMNNGFSITKLVHRYYTGYNAKELNEDTELGSTEHELSATNCVELLNSPVGDYAILFVLYSEENDKNLDCALINGCELAIISHTAEQYSIGRCEDKFVKIFTAYNVYLSLLLAGFIGEDIEKCVFNRLNPVMAFLSNCERQGFNDSTMKYLLSVSAANCVYPETKNVMKNALKGNPIEVKERFVGNMTYLCSAMSDLLIKMEHKEEIEDAEVDTVYTILKMAQLELMQGGTTK